MTVLIADDERNIREAVQRYLALEDITTETAENGLAAQRMLGERVFDAVILDLRMPGLDGLELLAWIAAERPRLPVIVISAHGEIEDAVEAMKLGARDYLVKPFDPDELVLRLRRVLEARRLADAVDAAPPADADLVGSGPELQKIRRLVGRVAATPSTVLITGESGTGKEVIARAIHRQSPRSDAPFVAVNLGGVPESLLESELFGHEKGSFTGADDRRIGRFEVAGNGTLFLDEIGDMPLHLQVKLLRVLQERSFARLGSARPIPLGARVVAATNRDVEAMVEAGEFREDLYYRLNVVRVPVPALRDHPEDIPQLVGHLIGRLNKRLNLGVVGLDEDALETLKEHPFPGNVRELENLLERAMIFAEGDRLTATDLALPPRRTSPTPRPGTVRSLEKQAVIEALRRWEGNRTRAAEELGITRRTLLNKIKQYGIDIPTRG